MNGKKTMAGRALLLIATTSFAFACSGNIPGEQGGRDEDDDRTSDDDDSAGGQAGGGMNEGGAGGTVVESCTAHVTLPGLHRLSRLQYLNTVRALVPDLASGDTLVTLDRDPSVTIFETEASALSATSVFVETVALNADLAAQKAVTRLDTLLGCKPTSPAEELSCVRGFITRFGRRVFRRPLDDAEQSRFVNLYQAERTAIDHAGAVELLVTAFLQAPEFLYRITIAETVPASYQRAERLAFLLWQSGPDDALLDAAAAGELDTAEGLTRQARALIEAEKARVRTTFVDFHRQWLDVDRIDVPEWNEKDTRLYPKWSAEAIRAVRTEADAFVASVFERGGTLKELLTDTTVVADATIANLYGLPGAGTHTTAERPGVLSRAFFLASHAHRRNGSPPLRGHAIMRRLFCTSLPDPPDDADTSNPGDAGDAAQFTNRELFERRVAHQPCINCHSIMDAFAYPLEAYDAVGGFRETDNGKPVKTSTTLKQGDVNGSYEGLAAMAEAMAGSEQVGRCLAENLATWALGRRPRIEDQEECLIDELGRSLAHGKTFANALEDLAIAVALAP